MRQSMAAENNELLNLFPVYEHNSQSSMFKWTDYRYDQRGLALNPQGGLPPLVTGHPYQREAELVEYGLAAEFNFGFQNSPEGVENFTQAMHLLSSAYNGTMAQGNVVALLTAGKTKEQLYPNSRRPMTFDAILEETKSNFGIVQKQQHGLLQRLDKLGDEMYDSSGSRPTHVILPAGSEKFIQFDSMHSFNQATGKVSAPGTLSLPNGITGIRSVNFRMGGGGSNDPVKQDVDCGGFHAFLLENSLPPAGARGRGNLNHSTLMRDVKIFSQPANDFVQRSYEKAAANVLLGVHAANGEDYTVKNWLMLEDDERLHDYMKRHGVTKQLYERIVHLIADSAMGTARYPRFATGGDRSERTALVTNCLLRAAKSQMRLLDLDLSVNSYLQDYESGRDVEERSFSLNGVGNDGITASDNDNNGRVEMVGMDIFRFYNAVLERGAFGASDVGNRFATALDGISEEDRQRLAMHAAVEHLFWHKNIGETDLLKFGEIMTGLMRNDVVCPIDVIGFRPNKCFRMGSMIAVHQPGLGITPVSNANCNVSVAGGRKTILVNFTIEFVSIVRRPDHVAVGQNVYSHGYKSGCGVVAWEADDLANISNSEGRRAKDIYDICVISGTFHPAHETVMDVTGQFPDKLQEADPESGKGEHYANAEFYSDIYKFSHNVEEGSFFDLGQDATNTVVFQEATQYNIYGQDMWKGSKPEQGMWESLTYPGAAKKRSGQVVSFTPENLNARRMGHLV